MNILINSYCNLHCPYCFADSTMKKNAKHQCLDMSEEDFRFALTKLKQFGDHQARLIGGEPTISPNFLKYLQICVDDAWIDNILIFSNLTFKADITKEICRLSQNKQISILPNINEFDLLVPEHRKNILYNIDYFSAHLNSFNTLGINIYRPDMDLTQWKMLLVKYPQFRRLRYSIAVPSEQTLKDNFNFYNYFHSFEPLLIDLAHFSAQHNIEIGCDCNNLPLCCFSSEAVVEMLKATDMNLIGRVGKCGFPVIDVSPDLTIVSCFGGNAICKKHNLSEFNSYQDIHDIFEKESAEYIDTHIARKECLTCSLYKRMGTSCSCKSTHLVEKEKTNE